MNGISADEKYKDFKITVSRGLTADGKDQYQILISQNLRNEFGINYSMMTFSTEEWEAIGKVVSALKNNIGIHILTTAE